MSAFDLDRPKPTPFFKITFSQIEGVKVESNLPKGILYFELSKYLKFLEATSYPGDGLVPPPVPPMGGRQPPPG
jgi:hypothetical protein